MEHASSGMAALPTDVLIVEDDPIIALDFEDTLIGFGVKTVRTAASVARALQMIAERAPDFALLDVGLVREKSFAVAERLEALKVSFVFVTGYTAGVGAPAAFCEHAEAAKALFVRDAAGGVAALVGRGRKRLKSRPAFDPCGRLRRDIPAWTRRPRFGVRIKPGLKQGDDHGGAAVGRGAKIGLEGTARLGGHAGP